MSQITSRPDRRLRVAGAAALACLVIGVILLGLAGQPIGWALAPALAAGLASWLAAGADDRTSVLVAPPAPQAPPRADDARRLMDSMIENFALPLILTGGAEIVSASSASARRLYPSLATGRPVSLAIRDPDFLGALTDVARDGAPRTVIIADGATLSRTMSVMISALPTDSPAWPLFICVFEDLTDQRATERMRVDFVANASHELRTPLASLLGFIETLQGPARDDAAARERFLGIMREQANRMARLIDDLLSLSRAELRAHQLPTAQIDLCGIVREIIDSLSLSARERGVELRPRLPDRAMTIRGDRDDLLRLVENLVENAIRYGRDGAVVEIEVDAGTGSGVALSVRDHGPGIAAEHIPRLTERFYRADLSHSREMGGTGLGLAIVKHLVARHRARLDIESRLGEGATFRVIFPRLDG
jgi:two-component system phosphate regulon sensor histidine kinase PhoR